MFKRNALQFFLLTTLGVILLSSCGASDNQTKNTLLPQQPTSPGENPITSLPTETPASEPKTTPADISPASIPTPSELPRGFFQAIPFDGIQPVYNPIFVNADMAPFDDDELVLGVSWDGKAKAYPITVLRFREMVNDELAGIPMLVTY